MSSGEGEHALLLMLKHTELRRAPFFWLKGFSHGSMMEEVVALQSLYVGENTFPVLFCTDVFLDVCKEGFS